MRNLNQTVAPHLCHQLTKLGLDAANTKSQYMVTDKKIFLRNYHWDSTSFYEDTDKAYFEAMNQQITEIIPAFSIADMMALLPHFMLVKNGEKEYEATLDSWYNDIPQTKAETAVDALAQLVIQLLKHNILVPAIANMVIK